MVVSARAATRAPRRRLSAPERRARIVAAARTVFAAKGFASASLDDVAARARITKPVIYDHFSSKDDLYVQVLQEGSDDLLRELLATLGARDAAPDDEVAAMLDALFAWIRSHPDHWRLLFREPTGPRRIMRAHKRIRVRAGAALAAELLNGHGDDDPQRVEMMSEMLAGAMHALTEWWYDHRDVPAEKLRDVAMAVLWDGLSAGVATGGRRTPR
ncbi:MAG TPA: TetR/AcrR family transcriptional regulator [Actinomycetota bacterium]|nr:TetR/AcrR family transcriptional regulator [Actinomycetota bacterium]